MDCLKRISAIIIGAVILGNVFTHTANAALSDERKDAIVENCSHIRQSLVKLQYADSRTRTYLGSPYEAIISKFITPLNIRLVKNNKVSSELFQIQNDFVEAQADFRNYYVEYMRELDNVIATDCSTHPEDFYAKLEKARKYREDLRKVTKILAELADKQYDEVKKIMETL